MMDDPAVFNKPRTTDIRTLHGGEPGGGQRPDGAGAVRQAAVHALRRAGLRVGLPGPGAGQDADRPGGLSQGPLPRAAATAWWPARSACRSTSTTLAAALRAEVPLLRRPPGQGRSAGLRVGLPERRADVRQARGTARHRQGAHLRPRQPSTSATSTASTKWAAPAGSTSPTCRSRSSACRPTLGTYAYSSLTQASLAAVPFVLTLWPPLLMGIYTFSKRRDEVGALRRAPDRRRDHE